jgi:uncharacterized repeat protein (TIGR01451 family)
VVLTETVPANTTFNPALSTPGWVCVPGFSAGSTCTLAIGAVSGNGGGGQVDFAVDVDNPLAAGVTQIDNTASVADDGSNGADPNPGDNSDSDTTPVNATPDMRITKDDGGITSGPGQTIVYTLSMENAGDQDATGVLLTDTVPANTTFNPGASSASWACAPDNSAGSVCTFDVSAAIGGSFDGSGDLVVIVTFAVDVDSPLPLGVTEVTNTASIADDGTNGVDPNPFDNSDSVITVVNEPPEIVSVVPASQTVQYSDKIVPVVVTVFDSGPAPLTLSTLAGLPSALSLTPAGSQDPAVDCSAVTGGWECTWTMAGQMQENDGTYVVTFQASDGTLTSDPASTIFHVMREDTTVDFDATNPVSVPVDAPGGDSEPFDLTYDVTEFDDPAGVVSDDNLAGDIDLADVSLSLVPVGPGGTETPASCTESTVAGVADPESAWDYDTRRITCSFASVPVNTYSVQVTVDVSGYYAGSGEDVLVVYDPSLGFATGGGWFYWPGTADPATGYPGDRTNFGANTQYNKKATNVKGNLLLIRHLSDGSIIRLKSNAFFGLSVGESTNGGGPFGWASFTGKATYQEPGMPVPVGNYTFIVYVEDHGEPGAGNDRFWIQVRDKDGDLETDLSFPSPALGEAITLQGGNIVVPHKSKGRGGGAR